MKRIACLTAICTLTIAMSLTSYAETHDPVDEIQIVEPMPEGLLTDCPNVGTSLYPNEPFIMDVQNNFSEPEIGLEVREEALPPTYEDLGQFRLTAYCGCLKCNYPYSDLVTASGTICKEGRTIAVDPNIIPYGSIVEINLPGEGWHQYIAEDTGGAIKGKRIDIFLADHQRCFQSKYNSVCEVRILRQ